MGGLNSQSDRLLERVRDLLNQGADPNAVCPRGGTALWHATSDGKSSMIRLLLEHGADPNRLSHIGTLIETPLMRILQHLGAAEYPYRSEALDLLLERTTDLTPANENGSQVLKMVAWNGDLATVKVLVAKGAEIDHQDREGMTAFMWAGHEGRVAVMQFLLEKGADINKKNIYGDSALSIAIQQRDKAVLELLMRHGAAGITDIMISEGQKSRRHNNMAQFDMSHLDNSCREIFKSLSLGGTDLEEVKEIYNKLRASFNAEAVDFCCRKYITAELDHVTPGDRGIGRASTYVPRLGAYHRKKMASLDASSKLRLYNLIEDVMLRSYLTFPLFVEDPLKPAKYVDKETIFEKWVPAIYSSGNEPAIGLKILWVVAGFALEDLMKFFAEKKMSGAGLLSKDRTHEICFYYALAGVGIRLVEIG